MGSLKDEFRGFNLEMAGSESLSFDSGTISVYTHPSIDEPGRLNQDSVYVATRESEFVLAVADGMGGHPNGDKASRLALECLAEVVSVQSPVNPNVILEAIDEANKAILSEGGGLGTTLTICHVLDHQLRLYSIGDSKAWVVNSGAEKFTTTEQTVGGYAEESGIVDEKVITEHPESHHVINAIGDRNLKMEVSGIIPLIRGDQILLASDGLTQVLQSGEIISLLQAIPTQSLVDELVQGVHQKMKETETYDDLSVVYFKRSK